jgi:hypothetical protein
MLGCLLELSPALDERLYVGMEISEDEQDEIDATATRFRLFMRWYSERFLVIMGHTWVNASYIFKRHLVDFACTMYRYIQEQMADSHKAGVPRHSLTDVSFEKRVSSHLTNNWPDLVDRFQKSKHEASPFLRHTGPDFKLVRNVKGMSARFKMLYIQEKSDYPGAPLAVTFLHLQDPPASSTASSPLPSLSSSPPSPAPMDLQPSTPPRKRTRGSESAASTPNKTPSTSRPPKKAR